MQKFKNVSRNSLYKNRTDFERDIDRLDVARSKISCEQLSPSHHVTNEDEEVTERGFGFWVVLAICVKKTKWERERAGKRRVEADVCVL